LLGHKFIIKTDQKSLKELLEQTLQTLEQQQWLPKFLGYDFTIQYNPGKENILADALLRSFMLAWSVPQHTWLQQIPALIQIDDKLLPLYNSVLQKGGTHGDYAISQGVLLWKGRIMLPADSAIIAKVLHEFHASKIGGHAGITKTAARIST
jgi:hypothetical protein